MTDAQRKALKWLRDHGGDGMFDMNGVLLAAGESAPHTRATWNALVNLRLCEFYGGRTGRARLRLTAEGA